MLECVGAKSKQRTNKHVQLCFCLLLIVDVM